MAVSGSGLVVIDAMVWGAFFKDLSFQPGDLFFGFLLVQSSASLVLVPQVCGLAIGAGVAGSRERTGPGWKYVCVVISNPWLIIS